jgi:hypothetical protein
MATKFYPYADDAGTKYGLELTDAQQQMYPDAVGTLVTGYESLALLQAADPTVQPLPTGLNVRYIEITDPFFGAADLMVLTAAEYSAIEPTGQAPYPRQPFAHSATPSITGASGEKRLSN